MAHFAPVQSDFQVHSDFERQQTSSPMDYMPPVMFSGPIQFAPPPVYYSEANIMPHRPPPGFSQSVIGNGQNPASQFFNPQVPPPNIPLQPFPLYIPDQKLPNQRRPRAIAIIDPVTGRDILNDIYSTPKSNSGGA